MRQLIDPAARGIAVAALLGAALLAGPAIAAPGDSPAAAQLAQATTTSPTPKATPKRHRTTLVERVEARVKELHKELKITPEQEPQWKAVADAMLDGAQTTEQAIEQRRAAKSMTAVDNLKTYEAIVDAHAEGMQKLVPAFETLYASMSDAQKKNADAIFSRSRGPGHRAVHHAPAPQPTTK
jgi:periplasmic protein CpxP/Spy